MVWYVMPNVSKVMDSSIAVFESELVYQIHPLPHQHWYLIQQLKFAGHFAEQINSS